MHQKGTCWRDHWKVRYEVECGSNSNAALPSHLSISKPASVMKAVVVRTSRASEAFSNMNTPENHYWSNKDLILSPLPIILMSSEALYQ